MTRLLWIVVIIGAQFAILWHVASEAKSKDLKRWTALIITVITIFALNLYLEGL